MGVHKLKEEEIFYQELSERIRKKRVEKGLTLVSLAEYIGVSRQFMNDVEKGRKRISVYRLEKLKRVLGKI